MNHSSCSDEVVSGHSRSEHLCPDIFLLAWPRSFQSIIDSAGAFGTGGTWGAVGIVGEEGMLRGVGMGVAVTSGLFLFAWVVQGSYFFISLLTYPPHSNALRLSPVTFSKRHTFIG